MDFYWKINSVRYVISLYLLFVDTAISTLPDEGCLDLHETCHEWAQNGECKFNPAYMLTQCPASCSQCEPIVCINRYEVCHLWAENEGCEKYATYMNINCRASCGICRNYACRDNKEMCRTWANHNQCDTNSVWMKKNCRLSCGQCTPNEYEMQEINMDKFWCEYNTQKAKCFDDVIHMNLMPLGPSRFGEPIKYIMKDDNSMLIPALIYGTAGKQGNTSSLVIEAVNAGFKAIDTAANPLFYHEAGVGEAMRHLLKYRKMSREQFFIQTKFTPKAYQHLDYIPYDISAPVSFQVEQSVKNSLNNIETTYLDCLLLHFPMPTFNETMQVWYAMEDFVRRGIVKYIGVSNFYDIKSFSALYQKAIIKPAVLQNKFVKELNYDRHLRNFCYAHNIIYQSYWSLTANIHILNHPTILDIGFRSSLTPEQVIFKYLHQNQIVPVIGTTDKKHMLQDLAVLNVKLPHIDLTRVNRIFEATKY